MFQEKHRTMVENLNEIIIVIQGDMVAFINSKASEVTGYSVTKLMSMPFWEVVHPDDRRLVKLNIQETFNNEKNTNFDFRILTKDGVTKWLHGNAVVIEWEGKPAALNLLTDITDRKQMEQALVKAKSEWEETFDAVEDWITIIDKDRRIIRSNIFSKNFTGLLPKTIIGQRCYEVLGESKYPCVDCPLDRAIQSKQRNTTEFQLKDGRWIQVSIDPHTSNNGHENFIHIVRDISDTKEKEQQLLLAQKDDAFRILFGGIAHDYNNLLSVIWGNICLIRDEITNEEQIDCFEAAEQACKEARSLTHKYILLSKGFMINKTLCSFKSILLSTINNFSHIKCLHISVDIPDTIPNVELDIDYFKIALNNIISNGLEAMPDGGEIEISARIKPLAGEETGNKRYLEIAIKDYGCGIAQARLAKIIDPYSTTKEMGATKGSGLGLAVCQSIIKKHGGSIQLDSILGEGTTVTLTIPVPIVESHVESLMKEISSAKGKVILLMEDDRPLNEMCTKMLQRMQYQVIATNCEKECIDAFKLARTNNIEIALVLLDQNINGNHGGSETIKELHQLGYENKAIVVTGSPHSPVMLDYLNYGFDEVLLKPYTIKELETAVHQFASA